MFFGIVYLVELEFQKPGLFGRYEFSFFEGKTISVCGQADAECCLFIKDQVAFFFHSQHVIDPVFFCVPFAHSLIGGAVLGMGCQLQEQKDGGGEKTYEGFIHLE